MFNLPVRRFRATVSAPGYTTDFTTSDLVTCRHRATAVRCAFLLLRVNTKRHLFFNKTSGSALGTVWGRW